MTVHSPAPSCQPSFAHGRRQPDPLGHVPAVKTCPICKLPYGRTYEEHTGKQQHKNAVWARTRGDDR
jgi:hypothetical protein